MVRSSSYGTVRMRNAIHMFLDIAMAELSNTAEYAESYDECEIELMFEGIQQVQKFVNGLEDRLEWDYLDYNMPHDVLNFLRKMV